MFSSKIGCVKFFNPLVVLLRSLTPSTTQQEVVLFMSLFSHEIVMKHEIRKKNDKKAPLHTQPLSPKPRRFKRGKIDSPNAHLFSSQALVGIVYG